MSNRYCLLASRQQYLFEKCLLRCVRSWTPVDGRKDRQKHVECYSNKIHLRHWRIWLILLQKYLTEVLQRDASVSFITRVVLIKKFFSLNILRRFNLYVDTVKEIKQYQEKWLQHVQRMDTNRIPKQALQYQPKGRRNIGRPRKRWSDQLHLED